jgi:hypothetical protein
LAEFKLIRRLGNQADFDWAEGLAKELGVKKPHLLLLLFKYTRKTINEDALLDALQLLIDTGDVPSGPRLRSGRRDENKGRSNESSSG